MEVHQQILNQVDQRQVHVHQSSDQEVVLEAARHVVAANQRVSTAEAQALQAVVQARGEAEAMVNETRTQAQILSVRFAAELELAQQREQKLMEHIEGLRMELERRDAGGIPATSPNLPRLNPREDPQPQQPSNDAGNLSGEQALSAITGRLTNLEGEFVALRDIVQELWINQESWNQWSPPEASSHPVGTPQHAQSSSPARVRRMDTMSSAEAEAEPAPSASTGPGADDDLESLHVKQKDLHHMKFPSLPENAGAFRAWRNSIVPMISSYDRSSDRAVTEWILRAIRARSETEIRALNSSSDPYPRLDRVLASALTKPEHLKSHFGPKFQSYIEECEACARPLRGRVLLNFVVREFDADSTYGTMVSELELFSMPAPEGSMQSLKAWRDKARSGIHQKEPRREGLSGCGPG
eukprot:s212_g5.t1